MLVLSPPMQALLNADIIGWTRCSEFQALTRWTHVNDLMMAVNRQDPGFWKLDLSLSAYQTHLEISVPRRNRRGLGTDITSLHADILAWIQTLDLVPLGILAEQLGAWLMLHGLTGLCTIQLTRNPHRIHMMIIDPDTGGMVQSPIPQAMVQALTPELDRVWARQGTPTRSTWNTTGKILPLQDRMFRLNFPTTQHARMQSMHALRPDLRGIFLPQVQS